MIETIDILGLAFIPAFILLGAFYSSRNYKTPRGWRIRGVIVTVAAVWLSITVATAWSSLFGDFSLYDLSGLGAIPGAIAGILVYELVHYWYHRAAHRFDWLWRLAHQMHHSAEAVDSFGAYYLHPVDVFFFTTWASLVFVPVLGLSGEAVAIAAAFLTFNAMFQHANIKTPRWLGYIIQRPESHCVHHGRGIHHYNYSDLPLWDMIFGTFINPHHVDELDAGFYRGGSTRIPEMLMFRDVSVPKRNDAALEPYQQQQESGQ